MKVNVSGGEMPTKEIEAYMQRAKDIYPNKIVSQMDIKIDGDFVDIEYHFATVPFERIRRITGYLVGTTDRFNNAKRAEEHDRVKHSVCC